ncbi:MAG: monovalent cation/H(+) antiporter subunit G [Spirochaetales bacterium]|nr:monovalent cation/H(+) antiporter subunit G [Spirochaetales bacterium]
MVRSGIALAAFASAVVFGLGGIVGLHRFPDPYARLQASSLCGTTAVFSIMIGCLAWADSWAMASRLAVIILFFLISNPTGSHLAARFAWNSGIDPWRPEPPSHGTRRRPRSPSPSTGTPATGAGTGTDEAAPSDTARGEAHP